MRSRVSLLHTFCMIPCAFWANAAANDRMVGPDEERPVGAMNFVADDSLCCRQVGDSDNDGGFFINDLVYMVDYLFGGGPVPPCREQADLIQDCQLDIQDLTVIILYMFGSGPAPPECQYCPNWHLEDTD